MVVLQEFSDLLCVQDGFWQQRLALAIGLHGEPLGLLHQALNEQTKPLRRYFAVRMLLCMAGDFPEVPLLLHFCADACLCLDSFQRHGYCQSNVVSLMRHFHGLNSSSDKKSEEQPLLIVMCQHGIMPACQVIVL